MGWTVNIENEKGDVINTMTHEFVMPSLPINYSPSFRILKYLDEFGDTTFNAKMLEDLAFDLIELRGAFISGEESINELLGLVDQCRKGIHIYLKFYGD